ncbi:hypothetical protein ANACOL_01587 [Anaerotruncus colihominis DSM 17241]|uniref:Uncharacterized protein n=1 Tax=Anaerotruncus colihominis DSM 17241 TaxID=445972 RepID=B0PA18_9FIRM|nr:hypothetical protein ANACOL_01587 [Anaerotruncus colihominis DSM 17241]
MKGKRRGQDGRPAASQTAFKRFCVTAARGDVEGTIYTNAFHMDVGSTPNYMEV